MAEHCPPIIVAPKLFARRSIMFYTVANGGNEPTNSGQLWVSYGDGEPTMQHAVGVGPVDVWFKCLLAHAAARGLFPQGLRFNGGDHFVIHSRGNGSTAQGLVRVRLYHGEAHADGEGTHENILIACADALLSAANGLLLDKSSGALPPEPAAVETA